MIRVTVGLIQQPRSDVRGDLSNGMAAIPDPVTPGGLDEGENVSSAPDDDEQTASL
jgi:hypothetical protein